MSLFGPGAYERGNYRYFVLGLLTLVYSFNFIDRQLLVILQESIKQEMLLSDKQLGLLSGFSFAIFYVSFGIPIARLADVGSRRTIVATALAVWSGMTAVSGLAQNYVQLLLARIGVAVGEAGGSPPAHAMISDIFEGKRRATALAIYSTGINIGVLFGFLLGGWINEFYGWRTAFIVVGIPGVVLAVILRLLVAEPVRGLAEGRTVETAAPPFLVTLKLLWSRPSFRHLSIACGLHAFITYGAGNFLPSLFLRLHEIETGELGTWLALASVSGALGTFLGGYLSDRLGARDRRWYQWVPALTTILTIPFTVFIYSTDHTYLALALNFVPAVFFAAYLAPNLAVTHSLVGLQMRALASAILLFVLNLVGLGFGPLFIGWVSDLLEPSLGLESIRYAMLYVIPVVSIWSTVHYLLAARHVRADLERAPA
ncbi:MAG: MFS transporter [Pseudomonadota bacterium]